MEIILIRHGKPEATTNPRVTASGFARWVRSYKNSGLLHESSPSDELILHIKNHYYISSDLKRAVESANLCTSKEPEKRLKVLREIEIPCFKFPFFLKAKTWLYLNRILWILGLKSSTESFKQGKERAFLASEQLEKLALEQTKIAVFSHGYLNIHIKRKLIQKGWSVTHQSNDYWGVTCLIRIE